VHVLASSYEDMNEEQGRDEGVIEVVRVHAGNGDGKVEEEYDSAEEEKDNTATSHSNHRTPSTNVAMISGWAR
jgi:hypothetical protein